MYADLKGHLCSSVSLNQKFSFTIKGNSTARIQSGSPGYKKGSPILAGNVKSENETQIIALEKGFPLLGIDEDGSCLTGAFT